MNSELTSQESVETAPGCMLECARKITASVTFSRSDQLQRLLLHLCDDSVPADPGRFTEARIAADVLNRRNFDARTDTIVRTQMLRLRQKLKAYYGTEGANDAVEIVIEKNVYRPVLALRAPATPPRKLAFAWTPLLTGLCAGAAMMAMAWFAWSWFHRPAYQPDRYVVNHPIWKPFHGVPVRVAIASPLFFRSVNGFERNFALNMPGDLDMAAKQLKTWPAAADWDHWASFDDTIAATELTRFLFAMNGSPVAVPARTISAGDVGARPIIVIGSPRGAPAVIDVTGKLNFHPPPRKPGTVFGGIRNANPRPGEQANYGLSYESAMDAFLEDSPDYALLTSIRNGTDAPFLNVFGTRNQSAALVFNRLLDAASLRTLDRLVFPSGPRPYRSLQVVFRVDYNKKRPTGMQAVAYRLD